VKKVSSKITEKTTRQFMAEVSDAHHAMAGAVIAASAAQAAALGEACLQISLDNQVDKLDWTSVSARIEQMAHIKATLAEWCDQDAVAISEHVALREVGDQSSGEQLLCESPAEISRLAIEAAMLLQEFRPLVFEQVQDDLEMAISLLTGSGRAAILLLDSNLRIWSDNSALLVEYEPILAELLKQVDRLTPKSRIRTS
jgi:formiminotetrahydrofolate cyclodeaminase